MAKACWQATICDEAGNVVPGASVTVRDETDNSLVDLWSDRAGTTPISNPFDADEDGFAQFFADEATVRITADVGPDTRTWRYVVLKESETVAVSVEAVNVTYDDTASSMTVDNVQEAIEELDSRVDDIEAAGTGFTPIVNTSSANTDADPTDAGDYTRFSHAAATYTFDDDDGFSAGQEFHGRYVGSGTLTLVAASGMTLNPPAYGSLVIPPGGTFTIKMVSSSEADVFGSTVPA